MSSDISVQSSNANTLCLHSNHLFQHPLCENQTLLQKIANLAFHILTLGIPLAIYHVVAWVRAPKSVEETEHVNLQNAGLDSVKKNRAIKQPTTPGAEALEFARQKLTEHPGVDEFRFAPSYLEPEDTHEPTNPEIGKLTTLYSQYFETFKEAIKVNERNPWKSEAVLSAADDLMKLGYAISVLTLEDLQPFTAALAEQGIQRTYAEALTIQDYYQYRTFYYCTNVYHWIRGEIKWQYNEYRDQHTLTLQFPPSDAHATPFYQKDTMQNHWRTLHNDYCSLVRKCVKERDLKRADRRHVNWTKKDTNVKSFDPRPDTQPT